jgi:hypothetical protein
MAAKQASWACVTLKDWKLSKQQVAGCCQGKDDTIIMWNTAVPGLAHLLSTLCACTVDGNAASSAGRHH